MTKTASRVGENGARLVARASFLSYGTGWNAGKLVTSRSAISAHAAAGVHEGPESEPCGACGLSPDRVSARGMPIEHALRVHERALEHAQLSMRTRACTAYHFPN